MLSKYKIIKLELSVIYIISAMLVVALIGLGTRAVSASQDVKIKSLHPNLYCDIPFKNISSGQKTIYFTFDDGPSHNTEKILDILKKEQVKATFFVCAQASDDADSPEILRRILMEGHEIGLHSYTHDYKKIYASLACYLDDLNEINNYIIEATGYRASIVRFPGGSGTSNASHTLIKKISEEVTRRGYRIYDWDVDSRDAVSKLSSDTLAERIISDAGERGRVIVLMHDNPAQKTTPKALEIAIPKLREQGYAFDKLTAFVDNEKK